MKTYRIKTQFSFNGYFYVNADNRAKAIAQVEQNTSLVLGGNINTSSDDIIQFEFDFHPVKRIDTYKTTVTRFNVSNDGQSFSSGKEAASRPMQPLMPLENF